MNHTQQLLEFLFVYISNSATEQQRLWGMHYFPLFKYHYDVVIQKNLINSMRGSNPFPLCKPFLPKHYPASRLCLKHLTILFPWLMIH